MIKHILNTFRLYDNRRLKKVNTLDITNLTGDQIASAIILIDNKPDHVWEFQKIEGKD